MTYQKRIKQNGTIWVSWPKKASGTASEVDENTVREVALPLGLVDIKVLRGRSNLVGTQAGNSKGEPEMTARHLARRFGDSARSRRAIHLHRRASR